MRKIKTKKYVFKRQTKKLYFIEIKYIMMHKLFFILNILLIFFIFSFFISPKIKWHNTLSLMLWTYINVRYEKNKILKYQKPKKK